MPPSNTLDCFSGVFLPYFLLNSRAISHGAKVLYAILRSEGGGELLLNVPFMAARLGEDEAGVYRLMNELDTGKFVHTRRHPLGSEFVLCSFPPFPGQIPTQTLGEKPAPLPANTTARERSRRKGHQREKLGSIKEVPRSRFTLEQCTDYTMACLKAGQNIKFPFKMARAIWLNGEQDPEVERFIQTGEVRREAA